MKTRLLPLLSVRRGASAIDFYQRAFGAEELFRVADDKGEIVGRMSVDGAEFWLADESPERANRRGKRVGTEAQSASLWGNSSNRSSTEVCSARASARAAATDGTRR